MEYRPLCAPRSLLQRITDHATSLIVALYVVGVASLTLVATLVMLSRAVHFVLR